jgi:hypothetical protein
VGITYYYVSNTDRPVSLKTDLLYYFQFRISSQNNSIMYRDGNSYANRTGIKQFNVRPVWYLSSAVEWLRRQSSARVKQEEKWIYALECSKTCQHWKHLSCRDSHHFSNITTLNHLHISSGHLNKFIHNNIVYWCFL